MKKFIVALALSLFAVVANAQTAALYSDSTTVPPLSTLRSVPGPLAVNLSTYPAFYQFARSGSTEKGAIGALGSFEMNMSYNMDYTTGWHRFYDQSKDAYWTALNEAGYYLQFAPKTTASGDVWDGGGNQYGFHFSTTVAELAGDILPYANGLRSIGGPGRAYKRLHIDGTNTAYVGNVQIDKSAGRINIAPGYDTITVTSSVCTASSHVFAVVSQNDQTAYVKNVVPGNGFFTVKLGSPATAQTSIDFFIVSTN